MEHDFDPDLFDSYFNGTDYSTPDEELQTFCSEDVPGLSSLGQMITYITVSVFSLLGNGVVVFVVCDMKKSRASTDIYLMNLAVADILFCLTLPFWGIYVHSGWVFGNFMCKLLSAVQESSVYGGVFLLVCISIDRYFAIVRATRTSTSHHQLVRLVCGVVWLVAGVLSLPVAIQRESIPPKEEGGLMICYENLTGESSDHWRVGIRILRHTLGFFLPLLVMTFCYGWTLVTLFHTRTQQKHKAMRVILAVVLAFLLCWLPHNVIVLVDTLMRGGTLGFESCEVRGRVDLALHVTQVFAFMHCAVNPVLYAFIGQKFRNQLLSALCKHGLISKKLFVTCSKGSATTSSSFRSRNTSVTL